MQGVEILRATFAFAHQLTESVMAETSSETLAHVPAGANINPAGAIFAHTMLAEDGFVQGMLQGKAPLYISEGWEAKTGIPYPAAPQQTPEWAARLRMDIATFLPYAKAVFTATDTYLAGLADSDLDRVLKGGFADGQKLGQFLASIGIFHLTEHLGEIAALKGVQGLKGLPF